MTETLMKHDLPRVQWASAIGGALLAVAIAIVLGLFGVAFGLAGQVPGSQGLALLSGVWKILTPLVATFAGAALAASMVGRRDAFLTGVMVWCMSLAFAASLAGGASLLGMMPRGQALSASGAALLGLSAILGFVGALGGAAAGVAADQRRATPRGEAAGTGDLRRSGSRPEMAQPAGAARGAQPGEPPEVRH